MKGTIQWCRLKLDYMNLCRWTTALRHILVLTRNTPAIEDSRIWAIAANSVVLIWSKLWRCFAVMMLTYHPMYKSVYFSDREIANLRKKSIGKSLNFIYSNCVLLSFALRKIQFYMPLYYSSNGKWLLKYEMILSWIKTSVRLNWFPRFYNDIQRQIQNLQSSFYLLLPKKLFKNQIPIYMSWLYEEENWWCRVWDF